jgi:magnesium transporter
MGVSLVSGIVVSLFNETLSRIILLTSFMPVISAISGNVGLQASVITVRSLATGHLNPSEWKRAWWREIRTVMIIAFVCGITLGGIAMLWSRQWLFGAVVGSSMFCAMSTAGTMGTLSPIVSKKLGFDPAATAGPLETTFQDIIGFSIFLGLATILLKWLEVQ